MRPLLFVAAPLPLGYRERMAESWAMILSFFLTMCHFALDLNLAPIFMLPS